MDAAGAIRKLVRIPAGEVELDGAFESPASPRGVIVFAHGSGSSRMSPRNRYVADALRRAGFATLLLDLLTEAEDLRREERFDIALLARRLRSAAEWALSHSASAGLPMGLFGASTGAAAALEVAAQLAPRIAAVVSRGGRPDLASDFALARVQAPTLLVVGGDDTEVIRLNEMACERMRCPKSLRIVPGATHLFEEPGALETVAELAAAWFSRYMHRPSTAPAAGCG